MNAQADFCFDPKPPVSDTLWLERYLDECQSWVPAAAVCADAGYSPTENNKRWVRNAASQSSLVISGQRGYLHLKFATPEEVNHACNALLSQARELTERAERIRESARNFER